MKTVDLSLSMTLKTTLEPISFMEFLSIRNLEKEITVLIRRFTFMNSTQGENLIFRLYYSADI
jgi:hypothetical protein